MILKIENRTLVVDHEDGEGPFRILPSSETGPSVAGRATTHTTWKWEHADLIFRIQFQLREHM